MAYLYDLVVAMSSGEGSVFKQEKLPFKKASHLNMSRDINGRHTEELILFWKESLGWLGSLSYLCKCYASLYPFS